MIYKETNFFGDPSLSYQWYTQEAPIVTTNATTNIRDTSATLNGYLQDDGGEDCSIWFEWGSTIAYGNNTINQTKTTGNLFNSTVTNYSHEYFDGGFTNSHGVWGPDMYLGQVFTVGTVGANETFDITGAAVKCWRTGTVGNINISISAVNETGYPNLSDILTNTTVNASSWATNPGDGTGTWYNISLPSATLNKGESYYLYWQVPSGDGGNTLYWNQNGSNGYTGGNIIYTYDLGADGWTKYANHDLLFKVYGTLSPDTLYHYRAVANNSNSTVYGSDFTFSTTKTIQFISIDDQGNGSLITSPNPTFNWTTITNTSNYWLQISNDSSFTNLAVNLTNINLYNYPAYCTANTTTISFTLPPSQSLTTYRQYYCRVIPLTRSTS